jgi:hypothetical protein
VSIVNITERLEEHEIERVLHEEANKEPRYPIIEKPEAAQLGKTIIEFTQFDSEGRYIEVQ